MSSLQDKIDALLPDNTSADISPQDLRACLTFLTSLIDAARQGSGFDREQLSSLGILQFCHRASTGVVYQINPDPHDPLVTLTSQTHFADGVTPIADLTLAQYHEAGETEFSYWYRGELIQVTGIKTLALPEGTPDVGAVPGKHGGGYIAYNSSGNLELQVGGHEMIVNESLVSMLYWNANTDEFLYYGDERHGMIKDPVTHKYEHNTRGFAWTFFGGSGDIEGLANNGNTFSGITNCAISDEDIPTYITGIVDGAHMYREGVGGQWRINKVSNDLGIFVDNVLSWNNKDTLGDGSNIWGLQKLTGDTQFISPIFMLTNNKLYPLMIGCSQYWRESRTTSRERMQYQTFRVLMDGLPSPEMLNIGTMLIHNRTDGKIEKGADDEIWICTKRGFPVPRFEDEDQVDG